MFSSAIFLITWLFNLPRNGYHLHLWTVCNYNDLGFSLKWVCYHSLVPLSEVGLKRLKWDWEWDFDPGLRVEYVLIYYIDVYVSWSSQSVISRHRIPETLSVQSVFIIILRCHLPFSQADICTNHESNGM